MKSKFVEQLNALIQVQNSVIVYHNDLNQETILKLLNDMELTMDGFGEALKVTRKAFNVMTECLQNIAKYADKAISAETKPIFIFDRQTDRYLIASGNLIAQNKVNSLQKRLEDLNSLDWYGVQQRYKEAIKAIRYEEKEDKNSAGLGFIEMARKSEQKFIYEFVQVDTQYSYFLFVVTILK